LQSCTAREVVAIKCVTKSSLNRVSTENLLTEIELLKTLRHENIVELKDFQVSANDSVFTYFVVINDNKIPEILQLKYKSQELVARVS